MQNSTNQNSSAPYRASSAPQTPPIIPSHFSRFATVNGREIRYDFGKCLAFIQEKGTEQWGRHFKICPDDHPIIFKLLIYAIRDEERAEKLNIDLKRGILLAGPVGCGKTSLMRILNNFILPQPGFALVSCREVGYEFIAKGYEVIRRYGAIATGDKASWVYCFDDLGCERNTKYFGNDCNVMAEILLSRYDRFITHGTKTHITTNLSATEIEAFYGNRVRSRLREMFNLVAFPKDAADKRR